MKITTIGVDLAKTRFQVHGVDERSKMALRKQLKRMDVVRFFANLEPCLIGMEACGSGHFWVRLGITRSGGSRYESGRRIPPPQATLIELAYGNKPLQALKRLREGR